MSAMDAFRSDTYSMTSLTGKVEKIDFVPGVLGGLGIFAPNPVRTRKVFIDRRDGKVKLIPTTALGAPPVRLTRDDRNAVTLEIPRLAKAFTLYAYEVDGIRGFNTEDGFMQLDVEYLRRMARLRTDLELTEEFHRLGAVQGVLLDADGTTVIEDFFDAFGITRAPVVNFNLDDPASNVRQKAKDLKRDMVKTSRGAILTTTTIRALCGDEFFDKLTSHPNVEKYYLQTRPQELSTGVYETFRFEGIDWTNYRGTDDGSTVAIAGDEAKLFPIGAGDVFQKAMAPAEFGPYVNTLGRSEYAMNLIDPSGREAFTEGELYAYPLYLCQQPDVLRSAIAA